MDGKEEVGNPDEDKVEVVEPVAKIVDDGRSRSKEVPIDWPVEFGGKVWKSIKLKRCTVADLTDYLNVVAEGKKSLPPVLDCPKQVYLALDDDDGFKVDEAMQDFLPKRLRAINDQILEASDK